MSEDAIDLKYAKQVADYIGSDHTEIYMTPDEVIATLDSLIRILGTYDITTIRASMGMYLICKAIHEQTDIRVLLTGEISDEAAARVTDAMDKVADAATFGLAKYSRLADEAEAKIQ